jgi:hypothetical protein
LAVSSPLFFLQLQIPLFFIIETARRRPDFIKAIFAGEGDILPFICLKRFRSRGGFLLDVRNGTGTRKVSFRIARIYFPKFRLIDSEMHANLTAP